MLKTLCGNTHTPPSLWYDFPSHQIHASIITLSIKQLFTVLLWLWGCSAHFLEQNMFPTIYILGPYPTKKITTAYEKESKGPAWTIQ